MSVMGFREYTRMGKYETKELLFEATLEIVERLTVAHCRVEGKVAIGRMGIIFLTVLTCLLGKLPYNGSVPQFLFERMMIKQPISALGWRVSL